MTAKSWDSAESQLADVIRERDELKKALKLMAKAKLFEHMEQVYEDDIEKEVLWFLGMAKYANARKGSQNGKKL
jgi:hypothetical protein